ncbi:hypothetical protein D7252_08910 [Microbacterium sp. CGR2]|nr:hypothetical protein D7252_08910 [Microbacterium sp. CGR2]
MIAQRTGLSERQVHRWLGRMFGEGWQRMPRVSPVAKARVLQLSAEQVPPDWIAETVKISRTAVDKIREKAGLNLDQEWKVVRLAIQHDAKLFNLHKQFSPTSTRRL